MKYLFWGTPDFTSSILEKLIAANLKPFIVITNPDRPFGRNKVITASPVKVLAEKNNILTLTPETLDEAFYEKIKNLDFDFSVLAAYGKILPANIISIKPIVVVHPSLLPKYRGATPIQTTLLNGDPETGTSLFYMDEKVDHGQIIIQKNLSIEEADNYLSLSKKLANLSAEALIETLPNLNSIEAKEQDHAAATFTKKISTDMAEVNLTTDSPETIYHKIKALNPEPGAFTFLNNKRVKLLEAQKENGKVVITKTQTEGDKPKENNITL